MPIVRFLHWSCVASVLPWSVDLGSCIASHKKWRSMHYAGGARRVTAMPLMQSGPWLIQYRYDSLFQRLLGSGELNTWASGILNHPDHPNRSEPSRDQLREQGFSFTDRAALLHCLGRRLPWHDLRQSPRDWVYQAVVVQTILTDFVANVLFVMIYVLSTSCCLTHPIFRSVCLSSAKQGCFSEGLESGSLGWIKQIRLKLSMNCDAGTSDFTLCWTRKVAFLAWAESLTQRCAKGKGWLPEVSWVGRRFLKHFSLQGFQKALAGKFGVALPGPHLFCFTTTSTSCAGSLGLEGCHPQKHAEVCLETVFWWCFVSFAGFGSAATRIPETKCFV